MSNATTREALEESKAMRARALASFEAAVRRHHADGMTPIEIARRLGVSKSKAEAACRRLGLPSPLRRGSRTVWRDL